jgi:Gpi18-like mannosyltransferase
MKVCNFVRIKHWFSGLIMNQLRRLSNHYLGVSPKRTRDRVALPEDYRQKPVTGEVAVQPRWPSMIEPWWKATLAILPTFLVTRVIFLLLTYFGLVLFTVPNYSMRVLSPIDFLYSWSHWDVHRYTTIASQGYVTPEYAAFFPLFPFLEHVVSLVIGNVIMAGMLISNIAFLGTLIVLYRLVEVEFDGDTAGRATLYLAVFPTALFFFAAYNESLFLFLMLSSFYAMRRGLWWPAGLFGGLATLTRSLGLLLLVAFLYEFVRQVLPQVRLAWRERRHWQALKPLSNLLASLLIPLGLGIYAYYLSQRFNDPLAFSHAETHWRVGPFPPWYAPYEAVKSISILSPYTFSTVHNIIDLTALMLFFVLLILCFVGPGRFAMSQWSMLVFGLMALMYPLFFPGMPSVVGLAYDVLPSTQRFILEIFPCFIMLARLGRRSWFHQGYLLLALPLLAFFVLQFITGHWTV